MSRNHPPTPPLGMQLDCLFGRGLVLCVFCKEPILSRKDCEWHHLHEFADGGEHTPDNLAPAHNKASGGCHKRQSAKAERDRHHIARLEKARQCLAVTPSVGNADSDVRCPRCGEYADTCKCGPVKKRGSFPQGRGFGTRKTTNRS